MAGDTTVGDYLRFLQELTEAGHPCFLEGGQAINFWADYHSSNANAQLLSPYLPFTSRDCDIWVGMAASAYISHRKDGTLIPGSSPADGQLGIFATDGDPPLKVDLMTGVYSIPPREMDSLLKRALIVSGVTVVYPLNLFRCNSNYLLGLDQAARQDEKHLRMLCLILPCYLAELIEHAKSGELTGRQVLKEIKLPLEYSSTSVVKRALEQIGVDSKSLFPVGKMLDQKLRTLKSFAESTWALSN